MYTIHDILATLIIGLIGGSSMTFSFMMYWIYARPARAKMKNLQRKRRQNYDLRRDRPSLRRVK